LIHVLLLTADKRKNNQTFFIVIGKGILLCKANEPSNLQGADSLEYLLVVGKGMKVIIKQVGPVSTG